MATCPLCGKKEHFYISQKQDKLVMYCQKCNAPGTEFFKYFRSIGVKATEAKEMDYKNIQPVEDYRHEYTNPDGTVAYYKRRRKWADGHKQFSFLYVNDQGSTIYSKPENCNNLYNLHLMARHEVDVLYIVEGEKCADAMVKAGLLATTSNTGAQHNIKLSIIDRQLLESYRQRIVIPDNDDKGTMYAEAWPGARVLDLKKIWPECPPKGDVADFIAQGGDVDLIVNYPFPKPQNLDKEYFAELDKYGMVDAELMLEISKIRDPNEREATLAIAGFRASELGIKREFDRCWKSFLKSQATRGIKSDNLTQFPQQPMELRCGEWLTGVDGVYRRTQVNGEFKAEFASPIPILPTEILVNVEDETERIRIAFNKLGQWKNVVVARSRVANKNKILDLADYGVEVNSENAGLLVKYIASVVALNPDILPKSKSIDHMGWADNMFIPYTDEVKVDCEEAFRSIMQAVSSKGNLDTWVDYVKPLRKNIYLRLIMAASFASPLIEKVGALPFVLHLWGGTGSGKTVAAMVAASVWGNPALGKMVKTMNMTVNSMMSTAAILRNLPFIGDELQTIKSRFENYDSLIMRICEGIDRGRMTAQSTLVRTKIWNNAYIFTGEEPCTKSMSGGGVKNRVIEIECTEKIIEDGNAVVNFLKENYGCAGRVFIESVDFGKTLQTDYQEIARMLMHATDTTDKQAYTMALLILADWQAAQIFFPGEEILGLDDVKPFLKSASEVDVSERAYFYTLSLIEENISKFATVNYEPVGICWGRYLSDGNVLINKNVLQRELDAAGFSFDACKKKWVEKKYLIKEGGRYSNNRTICKTKAHFVLLNPEIGASGVKVG